MGYVQLRSFSSFISRLIEWKEATEFQTQTEFNSDLMAREEYRFPSVVIEDYHTLLQDHEISLCTRMHKHQAIIDYK